MVVLLSNITGDTYGQAINSLSNLIYQTVTFSGTDAVTSVSVRIYKSGSPTDVLIDILNTSANQPTGSPLASASMSSSAVTTSTAGVFYNIPISFVPTPGTKYAIQMKATGVNGSNQIYWRTRPSGFDPPNEYWGATGVGFGNTNSAMFEVLGIPDATMTNVSTMTNITSLKF